MLILDDATSSVDASVEAQILAALREELQTTLVVIAYRLSTIRLADRVIYLEGGRVAGTGSHDELLATSPGLRRDHPRLRAGRTMSAVRAAIVDDDGLEIPEELRSSFAVLRRGIRESPELRAGLGFTVDHLPRRRDRAPHDADLDPAGLRPRVRRRVPAGLRRHGVRRRRSGWSR